MKTMVDFAIEDLMHQDNTKMVYVYDFLTCGRFCGISCNRRK